MRTKDARPVLRGLGSSNAPWLPGSFAWAARFRRLAKDYERLPETLIGLHFAAFVCLLLQKAAPLLQVHTTL